MQRSTFSISFPPLRKAPRPWSVYLIPHGIHLSMPQICQWARVTEWTSWRECYMTMWTKWNMRSGVVLEFLWGSTTNHRIYDEQNRSVICNKLQAVTIDKQFMLSINNKNKWGSSFHVCVRLCIGLICVTILFVWNMFQCSVLINHIDRGEYCFAVWIEVSLRHSDVTQECRKDSTTGRVSICGRNIYSFTPNQQFWDSSGLEETSLVSGSWKREGSEFGRRH